MQRSLSLWRRSCRSVVDNDFMCKLLRLVVLFSYQDKQTILTLKMAVICSTILFLFLGCTHDTMDDAMTIFKVGRSTLCNGDDSPAGVSSVLE